MMIYVKIIQNSARYTDLKLYLLTSRAVLVSGQKKKNYVVVAKKLNIKFNTLYKESVLLCMFLKDL